MEDVKFVERTYYQRRYVGYHSFYGGVAPVYAYEGYLYLEGQSYPAPASEKLLSE